MLYDILLLLLGLILIAKGGDLFVDSSVHMARAMHVPRIVIGGTLVALATTTPELVVSATASVLGDSGIALGNAIGSCIANIGLIIGTVAVISTVAVSPEDFRRRAWWMTSAAVLVILFSWDRELGRLPAWLLLAYAAAYLYADYRRIRDRQSHSFAVAEVADAEESDGALGRSIVLFLVGASLILVGSRLLVTSGIALANALGVPSIIIGLSVVAIGTSLPELVTGVASARKGVPDLAIGNILGANLLNLGLIVGLSGVIRPLSVSRFTQLYSYPWLMVFILAAVVLIGRTGTLARREGLFLLSLYVVYIAGLALYPAFASN